MPFSRVLYQLSYLGVNPIVSAPPIGGNHRSFNAGLTVALVVKQSRYSPALSAVPLCRKLLPSNR